MMLRNASLLLFAALGLATAAPTQESAPATTAQARGGRLAVITRLLQDPGTDAVALVTEAVRLVGFAVWDENRAVLAEPLGTPRLCLAITDTEIRDYTRMFRDGSTVARDDLIGGVDVLYKSLGAPGSVAPFVLAWLRDGGSSGNPSVRALTGLLHDLGLHRAGAAGRIDREGDVELDPIQALLIVRVLTEDLGVPLRRAIARGEFGGPAKEAGKDAIPSAPPRGPHLAAMEPAPDAETVGWAEDAYVGGVTGLFGEVVGNLGKWGKGISDAAGKANAIASIAKFLATYTFLKGELRVEDPGQPLIRTKDRDPGQQRTLVARFFIDGTRVTDWLKEHRQLVALAGLDIDMPKTGALKGIETEWDIKQDRHSSKLHLIQTVRGQPDISKVKTDENGEARIRVEGMPQPKVLDPNAVMPLDKSVRIVVTPQVKATEMQQDLVDAVTGAIGIKGGPVGLLTPVIECLYRMKWKGGQVMDLQIRDWQPGDTIGQGEITLRASGRTFSRSSLFQISLDRSLVFTDVGMQSIGVDAPAPLDPQLLQAMPPQVRKQMEEGMRQMAELAKKRTFMAKGPGHAELHIHDASSGFGEEDGCGDETVSASTTWDADRVEEWSGDNASAALRQFMVEVDLEKRVAKVTLDMQAEAKVVTTERRSKGKPETREELRMMRIFANVKLAPPFDRAILIPLKETEVRDMTVDNYYGSITVPFTFGPSGKYTGSAIVTYSVTRKIKPKGKGR